MSNANPRDPCATGNQRAKCTTQNSRISCATESFRIDCPDNGGPDCYVEHEQLQAVASGVVVGPLDVQGVQSYIQNVDFAAGLNLEVLDFSGLQVESKNSADVAAVSFCFSREPSGESSNSGLGVIWPATAVPSGSYVTISYAVESKSINDTVSGCFLVSWEVDSIRG